MGEGILATPTPNRLQCKPLLFVGPSPRLPMQLQVTYPASAEHASAQTVNGILRALGLSHLISLGSGGDGAGGDEGPYHGGGVPTRNSRVFGASARRRSSSRFPTSAYGEADGACRSVSDFGGTGRHGRRCNSGSGEDDGSGGGGGVSGRNSEDAAASDGEGTETETDTSPLIAAGAGGTAGTCTTTSCYSSSSSAAGLLPRPADGGRRRRGGSITPNSNVAGGDSVTSAYTPSASSVVVAAAAAAEQERPAAWLRTAREVGLWWHQLQQQHQQPRQHPLPYPPTDDDDDDEEEEDEGSDGRWGRRSRRSRASKKTEKRRRRRRMKEGRRRRGRTEAATTPRPPPPKLPRDWASVLSIGEQQRLGIARVLYHRPALAFLDEAMSAITEEAERDAYGLMRDAGVTVVAVGHRTSLRALHERVLALGGAPDGGWELSGISSGTEISGSEIPCAGNGDDAVSMA